MDANSQTWLIVFVGITGFAVLLQACVLLGMFLAMRKAIATMTQATDHMKATVMPLVQSTRELIDKVGPQVVAVTADVAALAALLHRETTSAKTSFSEIVDRLNKQTARLDSLLNNQTARLDTMLTSSLNSVEHAGKLLEHAVAIPVRQVNGVFAAFKAVVETYRSETPRRRQTLSQEDKDLFI